MAVSGVVVDANALLCVVKELKSPGSGKGPLETLLDGIIDKYGLAMNPFILQEWKDTCGSQYIEIWLTDLVLAGKARELPTRGDSQFRKPLVSQCGLPASSSDYRYIACAHQIAPHYVLSEDMDLYDPKRKQSTRSAKKRAIEERKGSLCRYTQKCFDVTIGCFCHCAGDLCLDPELHPASFPTCHSSP